MKNIFLFFLYLSNSCLRNLYRHLSLAYPEGGKKLFFWGICMIFACKAKQDEFNNKNQHFDSIPKISETNKEYTSDNFKFIFEITKTNINTHIHPQKGLWLIQSFGAMPEMTNITQVDKNFPIDFSDCKAEILPKVNCESKSFWTKEGCFIQEINSFKDEKIWEFTSLDKNSKEIINQSSKLISFTAINTSLNARYYFAIINGKWYLLFADLRAPCSA